MSVRHFLYISFLFYVFFNCMSVYASQVFSANGDQRKASDHQSTITSELDTDVLEFPWAEN